MRILIGFVLMVTAAFLSACAPAKRIAKEAALSFNDLRNRVQIRNESIRTMYGEGTITIESPEVSNTGSFKMELKKPDSLRIDLKGPFGIRVGTFALSRERAIFCDWMNNMVLIGSPDSSALNAILQIPLSLDEILFALTGGILPGSSSDSLINFSSTDDNYLVSYKSNTGVKEIRLDRNSYVITSYKLFTKEGHLRFLDEASQIRESGQLLMPMFIRLVSPDQNRSITIEYDDIEVNTPVICAFKIPRQAKVVYR